VARPIAIPRPVVWLQVIPSNLPQRIRASSSDPSLSVCIQFCNKAQLKLPVQVHHLPKNTDGIPRTHVCTRCQHGPPIATDLPGFRPIFSKLPHKHQDVIGHSSAQRPAINSLSNPSRRVGKELFMPRRQTAEISRVVRLSKYPTDQLGSAGQVSKQDEYDRSVMR
jgi:hypothetical protein